MLLVAPLQDLVPAFDCNGCTHEYGQWIVDLADDDIEEMVNAIAEIHVGAAACAKHRLGAIGALAAIGMAGTVGHTGVSLGLGDDGGSADTVETGAEHLAEQFTADFGDGVAAIEGEEQLHH